MLLTQKSLSRKWYERKLYGYQGNADEPTVEDALDIDIKNIVPPFLLGEIIVASSPSDAGVIHKDMEFVLSLLEFVDESIASGSWLFGLEGIGRECQVVGWRIKMIITHADISDKVLNRNRRLLV